MSSSGGYNIYRPHTLINNWFSNRFEESWLEKVEGSQFNFNRKKRETTSSNYGSGLPETKFTNPAQNWLQYGKDPVDYTSAIKRSFVHPNEMESPFKAPYIPPEVLSQYTKTWTGGEKVMFQPEPNKCGDYYVERQKATLRNAIQRALRRKSTSSVASSSKDKETKVEEINIKEPSAEK